MALIKALDTAAGQAHQMMVMAVFLAKFVPGPAISEDYPLRHAFRDERFEGAVHSDEAHPRMDQASPRVNCLYVFGTAQRGQCLKHGAPLRRHAPAPGPQLIEQFVQPPRHPRFLLKMKIVFNMPARL
jgi:hypothetical protein